MVNCPALVTVEVLPQRLQHLDLANCPQLVGFPSLAEKRLLTFLTAWNVSQPWRRQQPFRHCPYSRLHDDDAERAAQINAHALLEWEQSCCGIRQLMVGGKPG
jgi:hypothetical protein